MAWKPTICLPMLGAITAPMKDALNVDNPVDLLDGISERLNEIADEEEKVFQLLQKALV